MRKRIDMSRLEGLLRAGPGLAPAEVAARETRYGLNDILGHERMTWLLLARDAAGDPMVWFLLLTSILFLILGDTVEAVTLFFAIVPLVGMDLYLNRRARASTEGLASRLAATATVIRQTGKLTIPATGLVPGDLVELGVGDHVPADGLIVAGENIQVDESSLTGEAWPVTKSPLPQAVPQTGEVAIDVAHWCFAGSRLLTGNAMVRIAYTGAESLYGEIVRSARRGQSTRTPLQSAIGNLVKVLVVASVALCLVLAWIRYSQGFGWLDAVVSALTLAVAALPEEFPVVFTVFLGVGVYRLAQRQALVQRAVVVENIGRVTTVCIDKTGTITEGRVKLAHSYPAPGLTDHALMDIAARACRGDTGDPVDEAILDVVQAESTAAAIETFPFTEDRKRETNVWQVDNGHLLAATKGAPEHVIALCDLDDHERAGYRARIDEMAANGHKVIACARAIMPAADYFGGEPDRDLEFVGLLAFEDPVRESVPEAIKACAQAGIHVLMITGDHPATATAVARRIGLGTPEPVIVSADNAALEALDLRATHVIARAVPAQKLQVVQRLQAQGEIVAVTGDGVNDVPALQAADVGLAMGERGTRSAREVSSIVLLNENFRTIIDAISEGRQLFDNLRLGFAYLLMIHIPLVATAALIPLAGFPLLYLPIHIVWLELVIHPTAMLVFQELPSHGLTRRTQATSGLRFFDRWQWTIILAVGVLATVIVTTGFTRSIGAAGDVEHGRAMALATLSIASALITAILSRLHTSMARAIVAFTVGLALLLIQTPIMDTLLHVAPLHWDDWLLASLGGAVLAALASFGRFRSA